MSDYTVVADENAARESAVDRSDYWSGDSWVNLEYLTVLGLNRYNMTSSAREIARRVVNRVQAEYNTTGTLWERYSVRGLGRGSQTYAWTALVANLIEEFSL